MAEPEVETVPIKTKDGPIFGYVSKTNEQKYYIFKRIPYARPPIGPLRFLAPFPIQPWTEVKDCTKDTPQCWVLTKPPEFKGTEDCLYLEVFTKHLAPDKPLPVMVWIGGSSYAFSIDSILDPTLLLNEDIVFVRCEYRVGPFGFLSINDVTAPGNVGLKDIVLALKWVQRNISAFGGDPNNVTLFGGSSGGAIVHFMMLSSMATDLFHKVIIQSASALNNWALIKNPSQPVYALAKELGIKTTCKYEIVESLRTLPAEDIMQAFLKLSRRKFETETDIFDAVFKPCIEEEFEGQQAFLTKSPALIIKSDKFNHVPMIIGSNNVEASFLQFIKNDFYDNHEKYNQNARLLVPKALAGEVKMSKNIGQQLLNFYVGEEEELRADTKNQYLQLISDYYFLYYVNKSIRLHKQVVSDCPIYYYILNYAGDWIVPEELNFFNSMGHAAEIPYIYQIKLRNRVCGGGRDSVTVRKRMVKMWTNFAKYSNPTPEDNDPLLQITWEPVESADRLNYLLIGSELTKGRNPFYDRMRFWDNLHNEHTFLRALVYFNDIGVFL